MQFLTLEEAKAYLKTDSYADENVITSILSESEELCRREAKLSDSEWNAICVAEYDSDHGMIMTDEFKQERNLLRIAILYALGYLHEHQKETDHDDMILTLRNILHPIRTKKNCSKRSYIY